MSTPRPVGASKALMFIAPLVTIPVLITVGLLLQAHGPGNMGRGFLTGAGVAIVAALVVLWRVVRHPERASTFERGYTRLGDERDDAVLTRALAVLGLVSLPLTGAAAILVGLGIDPMPVLAILLFALVGVLAAAFAVVNRRS